MLWYDYANTGLLLLIWLIICSGLRAIYRARKYWVFFLAVYTFTELISLQLALKGMENLWVYNISKPMQFTLLLAYFAEILHLRKKQRLILLAAASLVYLFLLLRLNLYEYNSWGDSVGSSFIIVLCVLYFYELVTASDFIRLESSEFWFCAGLFVFFGVGLCVNVSLNFLIEEQPEIARKLFYLLVINSIIFYLFILYALVSGKRKTR